MEVIFDRMSDEARDKASSSSAVLLLTLSYVKDDIN